MPSRKRAKGKERKLKQQARQSVSSSSPPTAVGGNISLLDQIVRRTVEQGTNNKKCFHGAFNPPEGHPVYDFINTFQEGVILEDHNNISMVMKVMHETFKKHEDVWKDSASREMVINIMLCKGTSLIMEQYIESAKKTSLAITFLENYDGEGTFHSFLSKATEDYFYMVLAKDREVVHFYKKRIPCSCLNKLYSEIKKSQDRGSQCYYCEQTVKPKDIKACGRCKCVQYCSKECQISDWPSHKEACMKVAGFHKRCEKMETTRRNEE